MGKSIAQAVIGAGYGDEGKGHLVDALAAAAIGPAVVVRSNGGAQAGHTVALPDGRRHVFHHVGSGALAGASTHLSRFFVHHPMLLDAERAAVAALGGCVEITADPRGLVTTPWDMLINQAIERSRDGGRHGSCGLGFGETIERALNPAFSLTVADLARPELRGRLQVIRDVWVERRLAALGVTALSANEARVLADDGVLEVFIEDCRRFADTVGQASDSGLATRGPVIFEGAQGLLLDQAIGVFPHVTRSHTGLVNMVAIAREAGLKAIEALYVTRAYATRHGAGPMPGAVEALDEFDVVDPTNAPNAWQGRIRYAPLDLDSLGGAIAADHALSDPGSVAIRASLAVTCLDQARGHARLMDGAATVRHAPEALAGAVSARLSLPLKAESWGPDRNGVRLREPAVTLAA
jgi:adenylosuccinate synthase